LFWYNNVTILEEIVIIMYSDPQIKVWLLLNEYILKERTLKYMY